MSMSAGDAKRIAEISDPFDPERSDLDVYAAMVDEFGASSVLDVGCGTGTLAETMDIPGLGTVTTWCDVSLPLVRFRWTSVFESDGAVIEARTTLRFRGREEIQHQLAAAGFTVDEVRDAPDRPGGEFVFVCSSLPGR